MNNGVSKDWVLSQLAGMGFKSPTGTDAYDFMKRVLDAQDKTRALTKYAVTVERSRVEQAVVNVDAENPDAAFNKVQSMIDDHDTAHFDFDETRAAMTIVGIDVKP